MVKEKSIFKNAWPYQKDKMSLPVKNLEEAVSFYETVMGFQVEAIQYSPQKSVVLSRDAIQIGLAENGGDSSQEGCFFEVTNINETFSEFKSNGLEKEISDFRIEKHGQTSWKVFYLVAPDGLCYCFGERQS